MAHVERAEAPIGMKIEGIRGESGTATGRCGIERITVVEQLGVGIDAA